jgi:hypothetical protein
MNIQIQKLKELRVAGSLLEQLSHACVHRLGQLVLLDVSRNRLSDIPARTSVNWGVLILSNISSGLITSPEQQARAPSQTGSTAKRRWAAGRVARGFFGGGRLRASLTRRYGLLIVIIMKKSAPL